VLYYLDAVIVIYAVEGNPADQQRALNHLAALEQAGHRFAINELNLTVCPVPVLGPDGAPQMSDFFRFFNGPNLRTLGLTAASFRVTPCHSAQTCHSGSARRAPAPLVSPRPKNFGNKLAKALPMSPHCDLSTRSPRSLARERLILV
jgi:hypothetical protein